MMMMMMMTMMESVTEGFDDLGRGFDDLGSVSSVPYLVFCVLPYKVKVRQFS